MCRLLRCLASTKTRTSKDPHLQGPGLWAQCPEWEAPAGRWEAALEADTLAEAEELDAADAEVSVPQVLHPIHAPRHEMCRLQCAPRGMSLGGGAAAVSSPSPHLPFTCTCRVGDGWRWGPAPAVLSSCCWQGACCLPMHLHRRPRLVRVHPMRGCGGRSGRARQPRRQQRRLRRWHVLFRLALPSWRTAACCEAMPLR